MRKKINQSRVNKHFKNLSDKNSAFSARPRKDIAKASINIDNNTKVRSEFNPDDVLSLRPSLAVPENYSELFKQCRAAYNSSGALRSIVDACSEMIIDGLEIFHTDEGVNRFYQSWFNRVGLKERAEQFCTYLFRECNVVLQRYYTDLQPQEIAAMKRKDTVLAEDQNTSPKVKAKRIPIKYRFYLPENVSLVGDVAGAFSEKKVYGLRLSRDYLIKLTNAHTPLEKEVLAKIPKDVIESLKKNVNDRYIYYPLPGQDIYVSHYKKEDVEPWATPIITTVLDDVLYNYKLKLAKSTALDGFYNVLRIWKLGDHKEGLLPSPAVANKLSNLLDNNTSGGSFDLIWDSMIDFQAYYPPIEKLSGMEEDNDSIYLVYGFPEELMGGSTKTMTGNNPVVRVKNLLTKLATVRQRLADWINFEINIVHENMGFSEKPIVKFKIPNFEDDNANLRILIDLCDRNIISEERVVEGLKDSGFLEKWRVQREEAMRSKGLMPPKSGPYHNPDLESQQKHELDKIKLAGEIQAENSTIGTGNSGDNTHNMSIKNPKNERNGRPPGTKDSQKRKIKANEMIWAYEMYNKVSEVVTAKVLEYHKVSNARKLTSEQKEELDKLKAYTFASTKPNEDIKLIDIEQTMRNLNKDMVQRFETMYEELLAEASSEKLTQEQKDMLRIQAYLEIIK